MAKEKQPKLHRFSKAFAKRLFERHPGWKQYAGSYGILDGEVVDRHLVVTIPNWRRDVTEPLVIVVFPRGKGAMWLFILWGDRWLDELLPWPHLTQDELFNEWINVLDHKLSQPDFPPPNPSQERSLSLNPAEWKGCIP